MADEGEGPPPSATVYVNNLNEKIKLKEMTDMIREVFQDSGDVLDVVAKKNLKAKGQAFIVFGSIKEAEAAIEENQGFEIFGKPMRLAFAKTKSDINVRKDEGNDAFEAHKRARLAEKERKQAEAEQEARNSKRGATDTLTERPAKTQKPAAGAASAISDDYLPPNKVLFIRELPEDYTKDDIAAVFQRSSGFKEVRTVPSRKGIAFVEYESEDASIAAREATNGMVLGEKSIRVTFQKQ